MGNRVWRVLACTVAVAGLGLLGTIPAATAASGKTAGSPAPRAAIPFGMSALTYHRMIAQIPLDDAVTRIRAAVARPGAGHGGFVEAWVNDDRHLVTVYWHGRVPADIQRLFGSLGGHKGSIPIRVHPHPDGIGVSSLQQKGQCCAQVLVLLLQLGKPSARLAPPQVRLGFLRSFKVV